MPRITINDVRLNLGITETYDIVNAIRNSSGDSFQSYVPLASTDNVAQVGAGVLLTQAIQNEFITSLVDRIGKVVITKVSLNNHLKKFKKGFMPQGRTIEQIFVDITKGKKYNPEGSEESVFKRDIPNVKTLFHERNRQDFYKQTIQDEALQTAFVSWGAFEDFVSGIINAIYNSAEIEEYEYMKLLIDNYYSKGLFTVVAVTDPLSSTGATEDFVKKVRATAKKMTLPNGSREYNALAVRTRTDMADLHLLIDADLEATLDVDVLAKAFNMDRATFLGNITIIDNFASAGLEAVLIDKDWYMVYDNLIKMETIRNPEGLYWNYFYHVWQVLSVSRFANAVAFVSGVVPSITQVIIDPTILAIRAGKTFTFTSYVRTTVSGDFPIVWSIIGRNNTVISGSSIDSSGVLTVGADQTGELLATATAKYIDENSSTTLGASAIATATTLTVVDSSGLEVGDMVIVGTETTAIAITAIGSPTSITLETGIINAQTNGAVVNKQVSVKGESIVTVLPIV